MSKRRPPLPRRRELAFFALVAVVCAVLVALFPARDLAMAAMAIPIFITCAWLGMRRSGQWQAISRPLEVPVQSEPQITDFIE